MISEFQQGRQEAEREMGDSNIDELRKQMNSGELDFAYVIESLIEGDDETQLGAVVLFGEEVKNTNLSQMFTMGVEYTPEEIVEGIGEAIIHSSKLSDSDRADEVQQQAAFSLKLIASEYPEAVKPLIDEEMKWLLGSYSAGAGETIAEAIMALEKIHTQEDDNEFGNEARDLILQESVLRTEMAIEVAVRYLHKFPHNQAMREKYESILEDLRSRDNSRDHIIELAEENLAKISE